MFAAIAINGGKVVQLGRRIRPNRFRAFLPIRRTYFPMFILSKSSPMNLDIPPEKKKKEKTHNELKGLYEA